MADGQGPAPTGKPAWFLACTLALVAVLALVGLYSGGVLQKLSIPGFLEIDLAPKPAPTAPPRPVVSRDFMLGRWQVQQDLGTVAGNTTLVYDADGTVSGWAENFQGGQGTREQWQGTWTFTRLDDTEFRLVAAINGGTASYRFRILDHDHVQNEDQNYVAVRLP